MIEGTKPASKSLTIQSALVTLLVILYQVFLPFLWADRPEIPESVFGALASAGLLLVGAGRFRAKKKLTTRGR